MNINRNRSESQYNGAALISFDEGPSENTNEILDILSLYNISAVFHLDPNEIKKHKEVVRNIIERKHTIGLSIVETLSHLRESQIRKKIVNVLEDFKNITGFEPKLVRLPRSGYKENAVKIAESMNLIVTEPTIDSEDIEIPHYIEYLIPAIKNSDPEKSYISLVLRDYKKSSITNLPIIISELQSKEFVIVDPSTYLGIDVNPIFISKENTDKLTTFKDDETSDKSKSLENSDHKENNETSKTIKNTKREGISIIEKDDEFDEDEDEESASYDSDSDEDSENEQEKFKNPDLKHHGNIENPKTPSEKNDVNNDMKNEFDQKVKEEVKKNAENNKNANNENKNNNQIKNERNNKVNGANNQRKNDENNKVNDENNKVNDENNKVNDENNKVNDENNKVDNENNKVNDENNKVNDENINGENNKINPENKKGNVENKTEGFVAKLKSEESSKVKILGLFSDKVFYED
ncbi:hypothetical protein DMUE_5455 [Dictyocoela muelleri]|nr:hypothetical protein DMUE_5455 [Dictyocoela muelleri]